MSLDAPASYRLGWWLEVRGLLNYVAGAPLIWEGAGGLGQWRLGRRLGVIGLVAGLPHQAT